MQFDKSATVCIITAVFPRPADDDARSRQADEKRKDLASDSDR